MEWYQKVERIGEGTYGVVFKSKDLRTGKTVAMKKVRLENEDEGLPATTVREISLLKELKHPNIVCLLNSIIEENRMYLIFEYLEHDLKRYLDKLGNKYLDDKTLKSFLYQILDALLFCHRRRILHRDLKPQNLLVQDGVLKLADFGLGRTVGIPVRAYTHEIVTLWYRAPEVLLGTPRYSCPVDIWSVGCIFAEMATKKPLFLGDSEIDQLFKIFRVLTTPTEESWPGVTSLPDFSAKFPEWTHNTFEKFLNDKMGDGRKFDAEGLDLIKKMFIYNPAKRIPAVDAITHPYFKDLDKTKMPGYNFKPKTT